MEITDEVKQIVTILNLFEDWLDLNPDKTNHLSCVEDLEDPEEIFGFLQFIQGKPGIKRHKRHSRRNCLIDSHGDVLQVHRNFIIFCGRLTKSFSVSYKTAPKFLALNF